MSDRLSLPSYSHHLTCATNCTLRFALGLPTRNCFFVLRPCHSAPPAPDKPSPNAIMSQRSSPRAHDETSFWLSCCLAPKSRRPSHLHLLTCTYLSCLQLPLLGTLSNNNQNSPRPLPKPIPLASSLLLYALRRWSGLFSRPQSPPSQAHSVLLYNLHGHTYPITRSSHKRAGYLATRLPRPEWCC